VILLWRLYKRWRRRQAAAAEQPAALPAVEGPGGTRPTGHPLPKLLVASLKMLVRDRRTMIFALAVPILFTVIFGVQDFNGVDHVKLIVIRPAHATAFAQEIATGLQHDSAFRVTLVVDLAAAQKQLDKGKTDAVVVIPAAPHHALVAYYKPDSSNLDFADSSLNRFVDAANLRLAGISSPQLHLAERAVEATDTNYYDFLLPGLVAMAVMNLSIIGVAIGVTRFREQQILRRMLATPLAPSKFLLAQITTRLLVSLVQAGIILGLGAGAFGGHIHGDPVWVFLFVVLGNLVFVNIGFTIAGRAKNVDSAQALAQLVTLPMLFLSGVFFQTSGALGQIVKVLPLSPLVTGMRKITLDGDSITKVGPQLGVLAAWVVLSFLIARRNFRFDDGGERRAESRLSLRSLLPSRPS
jgi:ABC-2 type transport system permease protein